MAKLKLLVNGESHEVEAPETALLLDALREGLGMTGTKRGCETSHCGACTVLLEGMAVHSCVVLAGRCEGKEIATVEGLAQDGELNELQEAAFPSFRKAGGGPGLFEEGSEGGFFLGGEVRFGGLTDLAEGELGQLRNGFLLRQL